MKRLQCSQKKTKWKCWEHSGFLLIIDKRYSNIEWSSFCTEGLYQIINPFFFLSLDLLMWLWLGCIAGSVMAHTWLQAFLSLSAPVSLLPCVSCMCLCGRRRVFPRLCVPEAITTLNQSSHLRQHKSLALSSALQPIFGVLLQPLHVSCFLQPLIVFCVLLIMALLSSACLWWTCLYQAVMVHLATVIWTSASAIFTSFMRNSTRPHPRHFSPPPWMCLPLLI